MKLSMKLALSLAVMALGLIPATGMASGPTYAPEHPAHPTHPSTPKGNAYGKYCKGESKEHVEGVTGPAFSACVKAEAQADKNDELTARKACQALSRKHVKGEQGTPFSTCVKGVAQMRKDRAAEETQS